ncbi:MULTISPECIES: hypothetical protein [Nocardia]|uniref:hypothetical protein n=1 Tax=Nocardia TaxID=1817 RepID=UPI00255C6DC6|nr:MULTISPECIES: hypothetical protein [Nocardia]
MGKHSAPRDPFSAKRVAVLSATAVITAVVVADQRPWHDSNEAAAPQETVDLPTVRVYPDPIAPPEITPHTIVPPPAADYPGDQISPPEYQAGPAEQAEEPAPGRVHPNRDPHPPRSQDPAITVSHHDGDPNPDATLHPLHDISQHNPAMAHDLETMTHTFTASMSDAMDARDALAQTLHPTAAPATDNPHTPKRQRDLAEIATAITKALADLAMALQSAAAAVNPHTADLDTTETAPQE